MNLPIQTGLPVLTVFLQGLLSFFSPCVLPLVPLYIGYLAGGAGVPDPQGRVTYPRKKVMINTLFFIVGVSFAFFLLGLGFTTAGRFFSGNRGLFARIGGVLVILFGVYQLGLLGSSRLMQQEHRLPFRLDQLAMNPLTALVMGFTFSFAWTPCVGPALASVLVLASSASQAAMGYALIGVYTLGFVLPFLGVGLFTGSLLGLFKKHSNLLRYTVKLGGVLMIFMGIMMYTGWMNGITGYLSRFGGAGSTPPPVSAPSAAPSQPAATPVPPDGQAPEKETVPAPDFTLTDQFGNSHTLSDYKGKVVFLNFWATWCGYCVKEMPEIQALYQQYNTPDSEVVVLGIASPKTAENPRSGDGTVEEITRFLAEKGFTYPNLMDTTGDLFATYGVSSLPTTFMIDREGNVYGYIPGQLTADMMAGIIKETLNAGSSTAGVSPSPPPTIPLSAPTPTPTSEPASGNPYIHRLAAEAVQKLDLRGLDDFGQVQAAYEYLIAHTYFAPPVGLSVWRVRGQAGEPQPDYTENRALSPLAFGIGSCEDYACAMVLLLRELGFEARYLPGLTISVQGDFVDHAWAAVKLHNDWYHLDPQLEDNILRRDLLTYRYFLKNDKEMLVDHRWGENLIAYAPLTEAQQRELRENDPVPPCVKTYPAPAPRTLHSAPRPSISSVVAAIDREVADYEAVHGKLPDLALNITPPVFGNEGYGPPD